MKGRRTLMDIRNINRVSAFTTKDGSEIRELLAYRNSCIRNQTLAEARLPSGGATTPHRHMKTEEIYYILEGTGKMQIGAETAAVGPGDAIAIPPGSSHQITNIGPGLLKFLCCCAPGYEHDDTLLEQPTLRIHPTFAPPHSYSTHPPSPPCSLNGLPTPYNRC